MQVERSGSHRLDGVLPLGRTAHAFLVDRLWPRAVTRRKAAIDIWAKDLGPSHALRKWFGHDAAPVAGVPPAGTGSSFAGSGRGWTHSPDGRRRASSHLSTAPGTRRTTTRGFSREAPTEGRRGPA